MRSVSITKGFRTALVPALFLFLVASAFAQHGGGGHTAAPSHVAAPHSSQRAGTFALGRNGHGGRSARRGPLTSLPFPFFNDAFDPADLYSTGFPVSSEPPEFLLQAMRGLAGQGNMGRGVEDSTAAPASNQPLMIELRGDRYVRVNSAPVNGEALPLANKATASQPSAAAPATGGSLDPQKFASPRISAARHLSDLPPTILIFRDGHSEQVSDYTIADGILYAQGDFYTDGYWNKKIALAALDLPQTLRVNASRNVDFELPTSPNEVIASF